MARSSSGIFEHCVPCNTVATIQDSHEIRKDEGTRRCNEIHMREMPIPLVNIFLDHVLSRTANLTTRKDIPFPSSLLPAF